MSKVRVRFAPSPTGYLHIGGARTALFNYLFARHHDGQFLLRIEDTDQSRSQPEMTEQILTSLKWLHLVWDEEIVYQSGRLEQHQVLCKTLLENGFAYPCFCSPDELKEKRKEAEKKFGGYQYDRHCLSLNQEEIQNKYSQGLPHTLRFRVSDGEVAFDDLVHGRIIVRCSELDDFIVQRSDGTPVYQIAVVSDDHEMGITHIIRGDDHLSNTPKQILIYRAMGWNMPHFAHVPLILRTDKKRLSKRHGAVSVEAYQKMGFLQQSMVNYLALLGWSPGNNVEMMNLEGLIDSFDLQRISKKSAIFDEQKLLWMNDYYINQLDQKALLELIGPMLIQAGLCDESALRDQKSYIMRYIDLLKPKVKKLSDFIERGSYFFKDPDSFDEKSVQKYWLREGVVDYLQELIIHLESAKTWDEETLETEIRGMAEAKGMGAGKIIHPVRLAITGFGVSPGLFELMAVLGKDKVVRRIRKAVQSFPHH